MLKSDGLDCPRQGTATMGKERSRENVKCAESERERERVEDEI